MAVAFTNKLATGSSTDATSFQTSAGVPVALTAGLLYLVVVTNDHSAAATAATPTLTDNGTPNTWVQVATVEETTNHARVTVFRARAVASESVRFTSDFAGATQLNYNISIIEVTGDDTSGSNGSGAIGSTGSGIGNSAAPLATVSAPLTDARNVVVGGLYTATDATGVAPTADWTQITESDNEANTLAVLWRQGNRSASWAITSGRWGAVAVEIKEDVSPLLPTVREIHKEEFTADATGHTTAAFNVTAGKLYNVSWWNRLVGTAAEPTVSFSNGDSATKIETQLASNDDYRVTMFRLRSTTTGSVTATSAYGQTAATAGVSIVEVNGEDPSGTNGSAAITQFENNTSANSANPLVTLTNAPAPDSLTIGCDISSTATIAPTSGWFEVSETGLTEAQMSLSVIAKYNSQTASWTTADVLWSAVAAEIKAAPPIQSRVVAPTTAVHRAAGW